MNPGTIALAAKYNVNINSSKKMPFDVKVIPERFAGILPFIEIMMLDDQGARESYISTLPIGFLNYLRAAVGEMDTDGALTDWLGQRELWRDDRFEETLYVVSLLRDYSESYKYR